MARTVPNVLDLHLGGDVVTRSPEHPFWITGTGWRSAGELVAGAALLTAAGITVPVVESRRRSSGAWQVHNITVAGLSTYFVGQAGVLVHNKGAAARAADPILDAAITTAEKEVISLRAQGRDAIERVNQMPKGQQGPIRKELEEIIEQFDNYQDVLVEAESVSAIRDLDAWKTDLTNQLKAAEARVPARPAPPPEPAATAAEPPAAPPAPARPRRLEDIAPVDRIRWPRDALAAPTKNGSRI